MAGRDWRIEARYVEYCSCDLGCPCESMAEPTIGICTGLVAFKIDKGHCEKVSLDGLAVVGTFYFPRAIHHGEGVFQRRGDVDAVGAGFPEPDHGEIGHRADGTDIVGALAPDSSGASGDRRQRHGTHVLGTVQRLTG